MRGLVLATFAVLSLACGPVLSQSLIPERRLVLSQDADLPGGDIASFFDTTLEACERACLSNAQCTAFTFNTRNNSCFSKANPGEQTFFQGAYSGFVIASDPDLEERARLRRADLKFLPDWDISPATAQAANLANAHVTDTWTVDEHLASAASAEAEGDFDLAARFTGAAINL